MAFNVDPRVASLSRHSVELVEEHALELWQATPGRAQHEFLDRWLSSVTQVQSRLDDAIERERAQRAAEVARKRQQEEAERQRRVDEADRQRQMEETERRRLAEETMLRRRAADHEREREQASHVRKQRAEETGRLQREERSGALVRRRIRYLFNITSVVNLASIAERGILCHDSAARLAHDDVSDRGVQDLRESRTVAGGKRLHELASLYFNPRNAMV